MNSSATAEVRFDTELIARYDGRGPRYTSYPTALQFSSDFTAKDYRDFAQRSNATGAPLSLVRSHSILPVALLLLRLQQDRHTQSGPGAPYLDDLHREIDMQAEFFDSSRQVEQLHLGGGTPTYLTRIADARFDRQTRDRV